MAILYRTSDELSMEKKLEHLNFLIKKKTFVNRWKDRALRYTLSDIAPRLSNELNYYLIEDYYQIIKQLNEPFQPCMNHYDKYNKMYVSLIITYVRVIELIRKVLGRMSAYDRNKKALTGNQS